MIPDFKRSNFQAVNDFVNSRNSRFTWDKENRILLLVDGFGMNTLGRLFNQEAEQQEI
ncbi:MAG: hypothetical protein ACP5MZ_01345 [Candidatus Micrarchaeia archaeon]